MGRTVAYLLHLLSLEHPGPVPDLLSPKVQAEGTSKLHCGTARRYLWWPLKCEDSWGKGTVFIESPYARHSARSLLLKAWSSDPSDELSCHVVSCPVERPTSQGMEDSLQPTASKELRPQCKDLQELNPTNSRCVSLEADGLLCWT